MSSNSAVGVCRLGLIRCGVTETISSIADPNTVEEMLCAEVYDDVRRNLLQAHTWNFATKRVEVASEVVAPAFEYSLKYALPANFLRLVQIGTYPEDRMYNRYTIEEGFLLSNYANEDISGVLPIVYIADVTDVNKWSPLFKELVSLHVAHKLAYPLTKKNSLVEAISEEIKDKTPKSKSVDGQDNPPKRIENSKIIRARDGVGVSNKYIDRYFTR